jgi:NAD(P)-dependent dehydrogenase (short-subunit alcohol dehydrogenase family)
MTASSRVAIVTGGNSGMGMGIVQKLVENGWKVAIADINENKKFAEELGDASSYHKCNVADYDRYVCLPHTTMFEVLTDD